MAKSGVQLATAYISLNVDTSDVKKQVQSGLRDVSRLGGRTGQSIGSKMASGMRDAMGGGRVATMIFNPLEIAGVRWAAKAGAAVGRALKTAILAGVSAGIGAAVLGAGAALAAGLERLKTIQRAEVQLSLKLSPAEIRRVKKDIEDVVKGTPISLDQAFSAVPRAISAGLRGSELKQYIKDVADLTASTGGQASFEQIDIILGQIRSKSKLTGEELAQLIDAGVDVRGMLKDTFGWDDDSLNKMLKDQKVGIRELQKATQELYGRDGGGLAKKMGETFDGAIGNLKASVARLGANVLGVLFGDPNNPDDPLRGAIDGVTGLTDQLDSMSKWVSENKEEIRGVFTDTKDAVVSVGSAVGDLVNWFKQVWASAQNLGSKIASGFNTAKSSVVQMWTKTKEIFDKLKKGLSDVVDDVKEKFNSIFGEDGWFSRQFQKLGETVDKVRDALGLGPATANAAAPGGGTTAFNPGPMAPAVAAGKAPLGGSTMGLSSVPAFGYDANGNPLLSYNDALAQANAQDASKPRKVGSDAGLLPETVALKDYLAGKFPEITDIGGYRETDITPWGVIGEHASGKAIDIMVPKNYMDPQTGKPTDEGLAWGDRVLREALAKGASVLWKQTQFDPDGSSSPMGDRGDPTQNHWDHLHVLQGSYDNYAAGGKVRGPGTGTSDSIPAMLSNGEHVLTADDVKRMGGQQGVYAFRAALQAGMIPGFAPGGAVDPSVVQDATDAVQDLTKQYEIARERMREVMNDPDSSDSDRLSAQINMDQAFRAAQQAQADLPIISAGGTPPDRSQQNMLQSAEDELKLSQQALADLNAQDSVPYSQRLEANARVAQAQRERDQLLGAQGQQTDYGNQFLRSLGFIPANAGNTGVAGTSSLANFIGMGNDIVGGVIDTGANLAQQAVSAGIMAGVAAGTFGGGAAAAPLADAAASYGIQLAANTAKRVSAFGFQLAGIGADVLVEQLMPFGAPRWLGYDYGNFMPQLGIQEAALGTLEQMGSDAINASMNNQQQQMPGAPPVEQPSGPSAGVAAPAAPQPFVSNDRILQPGDDGFYSPPMQFDPFNPTGAGGGGGGGSWAKGGAVGIYDQGGILNPGDFAFNASRVPEQVLTKQQWAAMKANASTQKRDAPLVENLYAQDMQSAIRELEKTKRRDMMQYSGRP